MSAHTISSGIEMIISATNIIIAVHIIRSYHLIPYRVISVGYINSWKVKIPLICNLPFKRVTSLSKELTMSEQKSNLDINTICPKCLHDFNSQEEKDEHMHEEHFNPCMICERTFATKQTRDRHIKEVHENPERNYKCPRCDLTFVREENLVNHTAAVHDKSVPSFRCDICEEVFNRRGNLRRHVKEVHERKVKIAYDCPVSTCHDEFARKDNLERHLARGKHSTRASCRFCKEEFAWKSQRGLIRILSGHYKTEKSYKGVRISGRCTAKELTCINMQNILPQ